MSEFMRWLAVGLIGLVLVAGSIVGVANAKRPINIPSKTLGGKQLWSDVHHLAGWRIQRNVWTDHYRLLDPGNVRRAWGGRIHCREVLDDRRNLDRLQQRSDHLVILMHGIGRSTGTFSNLAERLKDQGHAVANVSYASTRLRIEDHAETLSGLIENLDGIKTVSFVAHSMGGLVVRQMLSTPQRWQERITIHRIVQIAPPNQGSVVAKRLRNVWLYKWLYGSAGQQLVPEHVRTIAPLREEFGMIIGGTGNDRGINPWITGDNDGTVRVSETDQPGARDVIRVNSFHVNISNHPVSVRATLRFLKTGKFANSTSLTEEKSDHHAG